MTSTGPGTDPCEVFGVSDESKAFGCVSCDPYDLQDWRMEAQMRVRPVFIS
jgi:hypothetical protein